jgi:hypothetical protein
MAVIETWRVQRRDLLTLRLRRGDRLRCDRGTVWCTIDPRAHDSVLDLVLEAGQVYEAPADLRLQASGLREGRLVRLPAAASR